MRADPLEGDRVKPGVRVEGLEESEAVSLLRRLLSAFVWRQEVFRNAEIVERGKDVLQTAGDLGEDDVAIAGVAPDFGFMPFGHSLTSRPYYGTI